MTAYPPAPPPGGSGGVPAAGGPQQPAGQAPVCPRHPDQISYVTCQRCSRPACPSCQRPAPVGVVCVDCVSAADRSQGAAKTPFGGTQRRQPVVTYTLMALCIGVYLLEFAVVGPATMRAEYAFSPYAGAVEPWRMLTTAFLHGGIIHLAFNMYALWVTGPFLERYLGIARFLALYVLSALAGSVAVVLLTPIENWGVGTVGASGAVFGLFSAAALMLQRLGGNYRQILIVIAINVVISFTIPFISWQAHLGGLVAGALVTLIYLRVPKKHRRVGTILGAAGLTVLIFAGLYLRYAVAGLW